MRTSAIVRDAEIRRLQQTSNPFQVNEDPPKDKGRTIFVLYDLDTLKRVGQTVGLRELIATQRYFDADKVYGLMQLPKADKMKPIKVVRISGQFYIVDGHHRAIAAALRGDEVIRANAVFV